MKYKSKEIVVDAVQWFKIGDHYKVEPYKGENYNCAICHDFMEDHGLLRNRVICPGDIIINKVPNGYMACKPHIFILLFGLLR